MSVTLRVASFCIGKWLVGCLGDWAGRREVGGLEERGKPNHTFTFSTIKKGKKNLLLLSSLTLCLSLSSETLTQMR